MKDELLTSLRLWLVSVGVCCVLYPAAMLAFGQVLVPSMAEGSLIRDADGRVVGSEQIAQGFSRPEYFWSRPSAVDYNAAATGGSNLSPTNPKLAERARDLLARHGADAAHPIPADLVTASGSGVDPHISLAAARFQAPRVARARGWDLSRVENAIDECTEIPALRRFGDDPVVNVLLLNLALDRPR
jgi:K+-transporting ATPase ATPase C chain